MAEAAVPAMYQVPPGADLTDAVFRNAAEMPDFVQLRRTEDGHGWREVTAADFAGQVLAVARGLLAAGVQAGDRVLLMSTTRYEWSLVDYAIWAAGAVTVPVYETSSAEQVEWIARDSGAVAAVVESEGHHKLLDAARPTAPALGEVWRLDDGGVERIVAAGAAVGEQAVVERRAALGPDSPATVIYTSGTTGRPKGCLLTHGAFLAEIGNVVRLLAPLFRTGDSAILLFLPLAHVFCRILQVAAVESRITMGHFGDTKRLTEALASFRPTLVVSVPRVFEKVYNGAASKAESEGKGRIFQAAARTAEAYSRALDTGGAPLGLRLRHALFDRLVYGKLRAALGGRATHAISGGGPLGERLGHFFRGVGLTVLEGYGLTESCAATAVNPADAVRIGTVGRPLPSSAIRIAEDGEVLLRGPHLFREYWHNPEATAESFDADGWFRTGDLGSLDSEGYLRITGRKKEIIVTAGGKNVAPAPLEDRLRAHPLIAECLVVGEGRPYVGCLITIDEESFEAFKRQHGKPAAATVEELAGDEELRAVLQRAVDAANASVSRAESIRRFSVLGGQFTEAAGHLTPSLKLRRSVVLREFAGAVDALYAP